MRKIKAILILVLLTLPAHELLAWGPTGHRIVTQIAYDNLNCRARHRVDRILGKKGIVYWSVWADNIKSDTIYADSYDWHFQDFDPGMSDSAVIATLTDYPKVGGNLFRVMDSLVALLRQDPNNADALKFVIHLMGDRFCPMHTAHLDDLGGNRVRLDWFKQPYNLHRVWDEGIINAMVYSYTEYAECLEHRFAKQKRAIRRMSWEEMLLHNYRLTEEIYEYQKDWNGNGYHYVYHFAPAMEWQLYVAGIRLTMVLNELYG
ncbi:MAG: S1/P1 nuclease [Bacteroidales bacterium]|nr:S1/P1 nuclease [Bacteroidales bacterium]